MEKILELDRELFLKLHDSFRSPLMDQMMMFLSETYAWIPLHLLLLYLLFRNYGRQVWIWLLAIGLTILLADQITSAVMKPLFERLRPSHEPSLAGQLNLVNGYRGGKYGFASSHAANTFGIATLIWLILKEYRPWIGLIFPWALLVSYTRIYLGVHYPGDIIAGCAVGCIAAVVAYLLFAWLKHYLDQREKLHSSSE